MSTITTSTPSTDGIATGPERSARIVCGLAAAAAVVPSLSRASAATAVPRSRPA